MPRLFVESFSHQLSKYGHEHPGDVITVVRFPDFTLAVLADGMGSGITANVEATLVTEYLLGLVRGGDSLQEAMRTSLKALHSARVQRGPWAALNIVRISSEGEALFYSYEAPLPLLLTTSGLYQPSFRPQLWEGEVVNEATTHIRPGEAVLLVSDGVTQAGLGRGFPRGWGEVGVRKFLTDNRLARQEASPGLCRALALQAQSLCGGKPSDDISALALHTRKPRVLHILTGPPAKRHETVSTVAAFLSQEGAKVVCGGTTSTLVARQLGVEPTIYPGEHGAPAHYEIPGIDLACEGTVTLNRVNNIFDEPELANEAGIGPSRLLDLMLSADEIHFWVGQATNSAHHNVLKPAGILLRNEVVDALNDKLQRSGRLVVVRRF